MSAIQRGMLILLAVVLAVAWLLGFAVYHTASFAIHLLLIAAVVSLVVHFVRARGSGRTHRTV